MANIANPLDQSLISKDYKEATSVTPLSEDVKKDLQKSSFGYAHKISTITAKEIAHYEKSGKTTLTCVRVASKIITTVLVLFVIFSAAAPLFSLHVYWLPWAGLGGYLFLALIQGILVQKAHTQERRQEALSLYQEMLSQHRFYPMTEAELPLVDERVVSDQMQRKALEKKQPVHGLTDRISRTVQKYDLEADCAVRAMTAAQMGGLFDPCSEREWKDIRGRAREAKRELYQDHPGPVKKWFQKQFSFLFSETAPPEKRMASYRRKMHEARNEADKSQGALADLTSIRLNPQKVPAPDLPSSIEHLDHLLKRFHLVSEKLKALEVYAKATDPKFRYEKEVGEKYKNLCEEQRALTTLLSPVIEFFAENREEEESSLVSSSQFSPLREYYGLKAIVLFVSNSNACVEAYNAISEKTQAAVPINQKELAQFLENFTNQWKNLQVEINKLKKVAFSFPEQLRALEQWLQEAPMVSAPQELINSPQELQGIGIWLAQRNHLIKFLQPLMQQIDPNKEVAIQGIMAYLLLQENYPHTKEEEIAWLSKLITKIEAEIARLAVAERELRQEFEEALEKRPARLLEKMQHSIEALKTLPWYQQNYAEEGVKLESKIAALAQVLEKKEFEEERLVELETEVRKFVEKARKRPFFERTALFWKVVTTTPQAPASEQSVPSENATLQQRHKIEELHIREQLKQVDLSIVRTNRFQRIALDWLAVTVLLVVDAFVFSNAWASFGITLGLVGVMGSRYLVDYRLQYFQKKKKAIQMEERLRNPYPKDKDFEFESGKRRIHNGALETTPLPGNRPQLRHLKDVAGRYGLDGLEKRHAELLIYPNLKLPFPKRKSETKANEQDGEKKQVQKLSPEEVAQRRQEYKEEWDKARSELLISEKSLFEQQIKKDQNKIRRRLSALEERGKAVAQEKTSFPKQWNLERTKRNDAGVKALASLNSLLERRKKASLGISENDAQKQIEYINAYRSALQSWLEKQNSEKKEVPSQIDEEIKALNSFLYAAECLEMFFKEEDLWTVKEKREISEVKKLATQEKALYSRLKDLMLFEGNYPSAKEALEKSLEQQKAS